MVRMLGKLPKSYLKLKPGLHSDGGNLYLSVSLGKESNRRLSWIFRYRVPGTDRSRDMGLGSADTIGLGAARDRAREYRTLLLDGRDPITARDAKRAANAASQKKAPTFDECAREYIASHEAAWRSVVHQSQWVNSLRDHASPTLGKTPVDAIETKHVLEALQQNKLWMEKPETAGRVRQRIERVLDWAKIKDFRSGENPARWRGHLDHLLPRKDKIARVEHLTAMPYRDVPAFVVRLSERDDLAAKALAFAILTAARSGEILGARWSEIDLEARVWAIPAARMKSGREHRVPLSEPAMTILMGLERGKPGDTVFPIAKLRMWKLIRAMGEQVTAHGFRSAFRDWAAEQTSYPRDVIESALAHALGDKTEAAYFRSDLLERRRELMAAWGGYCRPPVGARVVTLRKAAVTA